MWTAHGLDKYELEDRDAILKEAMALDGISIPSSTFKKLYKTKLAFALLGNVPPETQDVIRGEVEDGVEEEQDLRELMMSADNDTDEEEAPPPNAKRGGAKKPPARSGGAPPRKGATKRPRAA